MSTEDLHYQTATALPRRPRAPDGTGPFPGVVLVTRLGARRPCDERAKMLANLGYLALAADIFGDRHIPPIPPKPSASSASSAPRRALRTRAGAAVAA
jgi:dienelactone hydrolase